MANEFIKCPECGAEFQISQAISHDIKITIAKKYEKQIKELKEKSQESIKLKEKELGEQFKREIS
jgi:DNA-directed RNA polymerase subunit M/transcription elongation factor TFIIS